MHLLVVTMPIPRIYADFNGLVAGVRDPSRTAVVLDTFGSLRDLSNAGICLKPDLPLITVDWSDDTEDLEGHGTAQYDHHRHWWVVEFDDEAVSYVPAGCRTINRIFKCIGCRMDLMPQIAQGLALGDVCWVCGVAIHSPIAPPSP